MVQRLLPIRGGAFFVGTQPTYSPTHLLAHSPLTPQEHPMSEPLQEYADSRGVTLRVDRDAGVLRGVKLIGLESQNGRRYRPEALSAAVGLYEGAKVNVNHPQNGPLAPRDYRDRLGVVRQVEFRPGEGLFGNLHFNPKHELAEQLAWDAEHNPRNVGFSHNVLARLTARGASSRSVEAITHVQSVDLVADPAATQGLFEQEQPPLAEASRGVPDPQASPVVADPGALNDPAPPDFNALTLEALLMHRPDLLDAHAATATAPLRAANCKRPVARESSCAHSPALRPSSMPWSREAASHCRNAREFARSIRTPNPRLAPAGCFHFLNPEP